MKKYKKSLFFVLSLSIVIILILYMCIQDFSHQIEIDLSGIGTEYSVADDSYQKNLEVAFEGTYTHSILTGRDFSGTIFCDEIMGIKNDDTVTISFQDQNSFGTPVFQREVGYCHTTQIHSIFLSPLGDYAIICLYSNYSNNGGTLMATYKYEDSKFICIGDITREEALAIIEKGGIHNSKCKWTNEKVDAGVLETLVYRSNLFPYKKTQLYLFSKSGFTKSCIDKANELGNVSLVTYHDILKSFNGS